MFRVLYGTDEVNIDVTETCYSKLLVNEIITIPRGDNCRAGLFTDPVFGVLKKIMVINNTRIQEVQEYESTSEVLLNITTGEISTTKDLLLEFHSKIKLIHGTMNDEVPEQRMAIKYLKGDEKVLEIGGNVGRNSLIIGSILKNPSTQQVTLESNEAIFQQLVQNRNANNIKFNAENSALSKRKLIQKGWDTIPSDSVPPDYSEVKIISFDQLQEKYSITFDTLVLDCEGAFYYILMDFPELLRNINTIIMENDYHQIDKKEYVDSILSNNGFRIDYSEGGGWGPCANRFFEVWVK